VQYYKLKSCVNQSIDHPQSVALDEATAITFPPLQIENDVIKTLVMHITLKLLAARHSKFN
jgi:hypothetical protein